MRVSKQNSFVYYPVSNYIKTLLKYETHILEVFKRLKGTKVKYPDLNLRPTSSV